jgi:hypothetical protein
MKIALANPSEHPVRIETARGVIRIGGKGHLVADAKAALQPEVQRAIEVGLLVMHAPPCEPKVLPSPPGRWDLI